MTTVQAEKIARRKLSLLQLAQELGNVSKACRILGYSPQHFYEIRRNFRVHSAEGLLDRLPRAKGPHPNRVAAPIEKAILAHALKHPTHGAQRVLALERFDPEFRERHIEVHATGELVAVDTFFAGTLKGVGKVYIQTVLDCFSR